MSTAKTIGQKLYEKVLAVKVGNLVVVRALDPSAPQGYAWVLGLRLEDGVFVPLARVLTAVEIGGLSLHPTDPLTDRISEMISLEDTQALSALSPDALLGLLDGRDPDPEWGIPKPFGSTEIIES